MYKLNFVVVCCIVAMHSIFQHFEYVYNGQMNTTHCCEWCSCCVATMTFTLALSNFFCSVFCEVQPTLVAFSTHCLSYCNDYSLRLHTKLQSLSLTHILCRFDCNSISKLVRNSLTDTFLFYIFEYMAFLINASYSVITTMSTFFCMYLKTTITGGDNFSRKTRKRIMWNDLKRSNKNALKYFL